MLGNDRNTGTIPEMNEDMASIIDQPPYIEAPSIFKIKLAEYKEHQNHSPMQPPKQIAGPLDPTSHKHVTDSFSNLNLDRDLNNLISKKPKRVERYGEQDFIISAPQKKKVLHKDAHKTKKSQHSEPPGKPYSMKHNTSLIKKPLKISIGHL